tara:strand:+ start:41 stop:472 length:432 start_codon:yes stop_codon:yes gene_type:complete
MKPQQQLLGNIAYTVNKVDNRMVYVHVTPAPKPLLTKNIKCGLYLGKPRIVLQNKILFKCGFDFGVNITFKKYIYHKKSNEYIIDITESDSNNCVSQVRNHGVDLPTIDIKRGLEDVFKAGSKVNVSYYENKIVIKEVSEWMA